MRKKIKFYKRLIVEILETLVSLCLFLERLSKIRCYRDYDYILQDHAIMLKKFSETLREELKDDVRDKW